MEVMMVTFVHVGTGRRKSPRRGQRRHLRVTAVQGGLVVSTGKKCNASWGFIEVSSIPCYMKRTANNGGLFFSQRLLQYSIDLCF